MSSGARREFMSHVRTSCGDDTFVRLSLSSPVGSDPTIQRVLARLVDIGGVRHLSFTYREERRDTTRNLPVDTAIADVERRLGTEFRGATLATTTADWQLQLDGGEGRLIRHRAHVATAPPRTHDEEKPTLLGDAALPWLRALDVVDAGGRPRRRLAHKHAQIDRYVEILAHLARDCGWQPTGADTTPLRIVDVGCGKGHLTFAAWHLGHHVLHRPVQVTGVEARAELVAAANATARSLGADDLRFVHGDIEHVPLDGVDALVALHACNTATDHAIRRGVQASARLIVVAPCCHQEVRPQLARPEPLAPVLQHGLMAERLAEWVTDGLRALVLEHAGYHTKVIEFVGGEHTTKNTMIAAVRGQEVTTDERRARTAAAIDAFRSYFGIHRQALDPLRRGD